VSARALQSTRVRTRTRGYRPWRQALSRPAVSGTYRAASYGVGTLRGPVQFALLEPMKGGAAIRSRPLRPTRSRCTLSSRRLTPTRNRASAVCAATPLSALDADPPHAFFSYRRLKSLHRDDPTSGAPCRSLAPASRLLPRLPAAAPRASLARRVGFYRESQDRPTVPSSRSCALPDDRTRRWRNDPERLPSCQLLCELALIPAAFQPPGPDALRRPTKPRTMPPL
jgi:hypothetical protein